MILPSNIPNPRKYGDSPYTTVVIHGGPGAPGEAAPVARELSKLTGVLEPLQTKASVDGQVEELTAMIQQHCNGPVTLIGHSWGAWLAYITAARNPNLVKKLILVSSGPLEEAYALTLRDTRLSRLPEEDEYEVRMIEEELPKPDRHGKYHLLERMAGLLAKADTFDGLRTEKEIITIQPDVAHYVWKEASRLRKSGELLRYADKIKCPVLAVHGDYDSHPAEGVRIPLTMVLNDFRFILLEHCGHYPWNERQARDAFFDILRKEI